MELKTCDICSRINVIKATPVCSCVLLERMDKKEYFEAPFIGGFEEKDLVMFIKRIFIILLIHKYSRKILDKVFFNFEKILKKTSKNI